MSWLSRKLGKLLYGTVIKRIWKKIILICIYATIVVYAYHNLPSFGGLQLKLNLVEILGVVTGLLLVFRTQIAYDRYWEGRNLWCKMGSAVGTLARLVWVSAKARDTKDVVEKKTILNLLSAFPLATKHYLRDEYAQEFEEVREYLSVFPEVLYRRPTTGEAATAQAMRGLANGKGKVAQEEAIPSFVAPSNVPSIIVYYLGIYLDRLTDKNMVDRNCMRILQDNVTELEDILSGLEKILRTPMPLAYSLHLEHCLHIYVMALPFQLVSILSWSVIPVAGIACFAILGILGIGAEIENPFGYDDNDLPLDDFCQGIINEIRLIQNLRLPKAEEWIINTKNFPCGPACGLNALEMSKSMTVNQVYELCRKESVHETHRDNEAKATPNGIALISNGRWDLVHHDAIP